MSHGTDQLTTRRAGSALVLQLDDPARRNPLTVELRAALREAIVDASSDAGCRAVVITGAGGNFCSGGDIATMSADAEANRARMNALTDLVLALTSCSKPVVAAVEGVAYGGGFSLALACDYIVASRSARFCASFGRVGLGPDGGSSWLLPRIIGLQRAKRMLLFGEPVDASQAECWGLVGEVCDIGSAEAVALERAASLAARSSGSVAASKALVGADEPTLASALEAERDTAVALMSTDDFVEAVAAFREKRPPVFGPGVAAPPPR